MAENLLLVVKMLYLFILLKYNDPELVPAAEWAALADEVNSIMLTNFSRGEIEGFGKELCETRVGY
jgi:hypothetical protein